MVMIQSCTAFKCKCKFFTVRQEQHSKFHTLLQLQNDSPETCLQGIYKVHKEIPGYGMKNIVGSL